MTLSGGHHDSENPSIPFLLGPPVTRLPPRPPLKWITIVLSLILIAALTISLFSLSRPSRHTSVEDDVLRQGNVTCLAKRHGERTPVRFPGSRGVAEGVSEKANRPLFRQGDGGETAFPWTNNMLSWQRTAFHFQPQKNWMNDPNGPMFYKGWYHFFYQYNPHGAVWGDIVWGHAVSRDLINWSHLPLAMVADKWYDHNGVWSGSATILPNGEVIMLYTGSSNESVQLQNLAYPVNLSDPLLIDWIKYPGNPIMYTPEGIDKLDFRDPTTAWVTSEGKWRVAIGSKLNKTGIALVYETDDFRSYRLVPGILHEVPGTGMWECVDFYPISTESENGLDTSANGAGVKHVIKTSLDDDRNDYYAIGTYNEGMNKWVPDNPTVDIGIGIGIRYDYGIFYASKTFYDQNKQRRILWGWIGESDSERTDVMKGWASVQAVPRTLMFDRKTGRNLLQWPVEEIEILRKRRQEFNNVTLQPGSVVPLDVESSVQVDIEAEFEVDKAALKLIPISDEEFNCSANGQASNRGSLGPFGLLVLADPSRSEQTPVLFYITRGKDGLRTSFCTDKSRSSTASDVTKEIYGCFVPVLKGEKYTMRVLVDHSIVEAFAQGGRTCITSRVYPTKVINGNTKVFLFNNGTSAAVTASVKIWQMNSALMRTYDLS